MESLFYKGFPYIARTLPLVLGPRGLQVSMSGVLCHKHPRVHFDPPDAGGCELGDLLIVVRRALGEAPTNLALLLQLKRLPGGTVEPNQRKLYTKWPGFRYDLTVAGGARRRVTPSRPHDGAQFGEIRLDPMARRTVSIDAVSATTPELRRPLADALASVIAGTGGRPFVDRSQLVATGTDTDWDAVIWDLVDAAADPFSSWGAGGSGSSRGWVHKRLLSFTAPKVPTLLRQSPGASDAQDLWERASDVPTDPEPVVIDPDDDPPPHNQTTSLLHIDVTARR